MCLEGTCWRDITINLTSRHDIYVTLYYFNRVRDSFKCNAIQMAWMIAEHSDLWKTFGTFVFVEVLLQNSAGGIHVSTISYRKSHIMFLSSFKWNTARLHNIECHSRCAPNKQWIVLIRAYQKSERALELCPRSFRFNFTVLSYFLCICFQLFSGEK